MANAWQQRARTCSIISGNAEAADSIGKFFFKAEDGIRHYRVTGVQTCALPILGVGVAEAPDGRAGPHRPPRTLLIEYDRSRRIDENYDKLRRYDAFVCWWIHHTPYADMDALPYVPLVCQDAEQRERFLHAAARLTGHCWHPTVELG